VIEILLQNVAWFVVVLLVVRLVVK